MADFGNRIVIDRNPYHRSCGIEIRGYYLVLYDTMRTGSWYDAGFLVGAGSPLLGFFRRK